MNLNNKRGVIGVGSGELAVDDEYLEMELDALIWRESTYERNTWWVPKEVLTEFVITALKLHNGKFYGQRYNYFLTAPGEITRYWKWKDSEPEHVDDDSARYGTGRVGRVRIGARPGPTLCPICGEPLDSNHRGQHHHERPEP